MEILQVKQEILADGHRYTGSGYYDQTGFIPQGCGKKYYDGYYVYGNFKNGEINGPAIVSHNTYMNTCHFSGNRANGWGLCLNQGELTEFGYYENSKLKVDLTDIVEWYFTKMKISGRTDESMLHMYTYNETKEVSELLIGFKGTPATNGVGLCYMGFRFKADGSVWIGTTGSRILTGNLLHFCPNGQIEAGKFDNGQLEEPQGIQNIIDDYYGTWNFEDDIFASLFAKNKSSRQMENEAIRDQYRNIPEIDPKKNYFI